MSGKTHWVRYYKNWSDLTPPLRPHSEAVAAIRAHAGHFKRVLLLGVTPELADIGSELVALDRQAEMIKYIWPGNAATRCAVQGNWRNVNFREACFDACIGDGSLNVIRYPDEVFEVCAQVRRVLRPNGAFVCRVYASDPNDSLEKVRRAAWHGNIRNFHAFKLRLRMAMAQETEDPNVAAASTLAVFNSWFPDRDELVSRTGWSRSHIDTVDSYHNSNATTCFVTEADWRELALRHFPRVEFFSSGSYEGASVCPIMVAYN